MPAAGPRQSGKQGVVLLSPFMILSLARAESLLFPFPVFRFRRTTTRGTSLSGRAEVKCSQQGGADGRKEGVTIRVSAVERNSR